MKIRNLSKLRVIAITIVLLFPTQILANSDFLRLYIHQLKEEGYVINEIYRSFFGRYVIGSTKGNLNREIAIDQHDGFLLRNHVSDDDSHRSGTNGRDDNGDDRGN